jgi:cytochrome c556
MRMTTRRWSLVLMLLAVIDVSAMTAQSRATNRVMRKKLEVSQKILEAVVTSRWADLEARSRDLEDLTRDPGWAVLTKPEYARHSNQFRDAVRALHLAASQRDLEATPKAYIAVTLSCVECHRYLARTRFAE